MSFFLLCLFVTLLSTATTYVIAFLAGILLEFCIVCKVDWGVVFILVLIVQLIVGA